MTKASGRSPKKDAKNRQPGGKRGAALPKTSGPARPDGGEGLQQLLAVCPVGVLVHEEGRFVLANPAALAILRATDPGQVLGRQVMDFVPPEHRELVAERYRKLHEQAFPLTPSEYEVVAVDGSRVPVQMVSSPFPHQGKTRVLTVMEDIGARKRQNAELLESQHLVKRVLDATPNLIYIYDLLERRNCFANREVTNFLGYSAEDVQAMGSGLFAKILHPDDAEKVARHHARFDQARDDEVLEIEYRMRHAAGQWRWLRSRDVLFARAADGRASRILGSTEDITGRRQAQEALAESEWKYRSLFDNMRQGSFHQRADGALVDVNAAALRLLGVTEDEFLGRTSTSGAWDVTAEDGSPLPGERHPSMRALASGRPVIGEVVGVMNPRTGKRVWMEANAVPEFRPGEDRPCQVAVTLHDLTERLGAEHALRESEERFRGVFENSPFGIAIVSPGPKMTIQRANSEFCRIVGRGEEELKTLSPAEISDPQEWERDREEVRRLSVGKIPHYWTEKRYRHGNGREVWASVTVSMLRGSSGTPDLFLVMAEDITTRRRLQEELAEEKERLSVTLGSIGEGVVAVDGGGRVQVFNQAAEAMTGWTTAEAAGKTLGEVMRLLDPRTRAPREFPLETVLAAGATQWLDSRTLLVARDGSERPVGDSASPIRDRGGWVVGAVIVFRDLTDQEKREEELIKAQKLESLALLAGGIAHDFNNILTGILGNISLSLMRAREGDPLRERLVEAENAALRAKALTHQLLTFGSGGAPVKKVIRLSRLLREASGFCLLGSAVSCSFEIADDLWPVEADEGQVGQVIQNLVLNGAESMPAGGRLRVNAVNKTLPEGNPLLLPPGPYAVFQVADEGVGIDPRHLSNLFDPYFSTKKKGRGLGLPVVYSIITRHGGRVEVASTVGKGTIFTVTLPASPHGSPADEASHPAPQVAGKKILVMDDEPMIRDLASEMLEALGCRVQTAPDGGSALDLWRAAKKEGAPFDLAIMDLTVPGGMGGKEAVGLLRREDPGMKAVVSSGYSNDPVMAHPAEYGFAGVLTKPYKVRDLKEALARLFPPSG